MSAITRGKEPVPSSEPFASTSVEGADRGHMAAAEVTMEGGPSQHATLGLDQKKINSIIGEENSALKSTTRLPVQPTNDEKLLALKLVSLNSSSNLLVEKRAAYQKEYAEAFQEARVLAPSLTRLLDQYGIAADDQKTALMEKIEAEAITPKGKFLVSLKKAMIVIDSAFDYQSRFLSTVSTASHQTGPFFSSTSEAINNNLKKLENAAASIVEAAKNSIGNEDRREIAIAGGNRNLAQSLEEIIGYDQHSINNNVLFAEIIKQGEPPLARYYYQAAQLYSQAAEYKTLSIKEDISEDALKKRLNSAAVAAHLSALSYEAAADKIKEEELKVADYYAQAADYYARSISPYATGEEELAASFYQAGESVEKAISFNKAAVKAENTGDRLTAYCCNQALKYSLQKAKASVLGNKKLTGFLTSAVLDVNKAALSIQEAVKVEAQGKTKAADYYRQETDYRITASEAYAEGKKDVGDELHKQAEELNQQAKKALNSSS